MMHINNVNIIYEISQVISLWEHWAINFNVHFIYMHCLFLIISKFSKISCSWYTTFSVFLLVCKPTIFLKTTNRKRWEIMFNETLMWRFYEKIATNYHLAHEITAVEKKTINIQIFNCFENKRKKLCMQV